MDRQWTPEEVRARPGEYWRVLIQEEPYCNWDAARVWEVVKKSVDALRFFEEGLSLPLDPPSGAPQS